MTGFIHSIQSMGAVDGPGIRFCIFLQGCPLRCMYCHNPDTWTIPSFCENPDKKTDIITDIMSSEELIKKALRYKTYFSGGGGVTVSGGEPLSQTDFVTELFEKLHAEGINTCLDTSGHTGESDEKTGKLLKNTDLCICDIKFTTEEEYRKNCGGSLKQVLHFLSLTEEMQVPLWVRHVVVPGITDSANEVSHMARLAKGFSNLKKIELLPFHKLCQTKYDELGIVFRCADIPPCSKEKITELSKLI